MKNHSTATAELAQPTLEEQRLYHIDPAFRDGETQEESDYAINPAPYSPLRQMWRGEFDYTDPAGPDYVEPGDSAGMFRTVARKYFEAQPETSAEVAERYARLSERDPELIATPPRATIAIPIAIHNEPIETLRQTLTQIAAQEGVDQDEVWLYGNMPSALPDTEKLAARAKLDTLVAEFKASHPDLKLRTTAEEYDPSELRIGRVRHDYMDLITWDAQRRGFGMDHPVIMLDADTRMMTRDTFQKMTAALTAPDSTLLNVHARSEYLFEDAPSTEVEMSDARRLAVLAEIRRRQYLQISTAHNNGYYKPGYDEEWGVALPLGAYVLSGGYNERDAANESKSLWFRMRDTYDDAAACMRYAKPGIPNRSMTSSVRYITDISVRSSGRRYEGFFQDWLDLPKDPPREAFLEQYVSSGRLALTGPLYDPVRGLEHTDTVRSNETIATSRPHDPERVARIARAILGRDSVVTGMDKESLELTTTPLPDPTRLVERLGLPREVTQKAMKN